MSRQSGSIKGAKKRADDLFSKLVRSRGACERCGKREYLQCAHIISRRYSNTRCVESNAFCLCAGCHHWFTDHPTAFGEFVRERRGAEYDRLFELSQSTAKVNWFEVAAELKVRVEGMAA